jgi:hypothetical protein
MISLFIIYVVVDERDHREIVFPKTPKPQNPRNENKD